MISENCSIDEFVETVKGKDTQEVIALAIDEATRADRMVYRTKRSDGPCPNGEAEYSHDLKTLIGYMRYTVKPKRPQDKAYRLYNAYWGEPDQPSLDH
jgi:hypothetical protein